MDTESKSGLGAYEYPAGAIVVELLLGQVFRYHLSS